MKTIDKIITLVNCKFGAPMGRSNVGTIPKEVLPDMSDVDITDTYHYNYIWIQRKKKLNKKLPKVFDCKVPMIDCAYDKGGAYWGIGRKLRVSYTKDLSYIEFYRK
jgi:hypothetical protein